MSTKYAPRPVPTAARQPDGCVASGTTVSLAARQHWRSRPSSVSGAAATAVPLVPLNASQMRRQSVLHQPGLGDASPLARQDRSAASHPRPPWHSPAVPPEVLLTGGQ